MRYLSGLKPSIRDKIGVHMVFSVQKARNLAMKAELFIQEQTCSANFKRYGGGDNKAAYDMGKVPQTSSMETTNAYVGKECNAIICTLLFF